jgi:hypothetical protein
MPTPTDRYAITVPTPLAAVLEQIVARQAARTGEEPEQVRRAVELVVLQRGAAALQEELRRGHLGAPGLRDPDFPCEGYEPGESRAAADCETDGHYLCAGCANRREVDES